MSLLSFAWFKSSKEVFKFAIYTEIGTIIPLLIILLISRYRLAAIEAILPFNGICRTILAIFFI